VFVPINRISTIRVCRFSVSNLQIEKIVWAQPAENALQACLIWLEKEELSPEPFRLLVIVVILLHSNASISDVHQIPPPGAIYRLEQSFI
jgi:hypothetical protein